MERNKTVLLGVIIVLLLAIGVAFWRVHDTANTETSASYAVPGQGPSNPSFPKVERQHRLASLKSQEILGIPLEAQEDIPGRAEVRASGGNVKYPGNRGKTPSGFSSLEVPGAKTARSGNVYAQADRSLSPYQLDGGTPVTSPGSGSYQAVSAPNLSSPEASLTRDSSDSNEYVHKSMSPFLRGLTQEQAAALNKSLTGLSDRVERAIMQAMLPKSKKDANIEKYLQRNRSGEDSASAEAAAGPFAGVLNQVSSQKANIVKSMGNAYGGGAAKEAGQIMNAYQKELGSLLNNAAGKNPEEIAKQARAISHKYNKKLDNMSDKYGLEKFKQETLAKDQAYLAQVEQTYGSDISGQMAELRQQALEQKMQLAQETGLTTEDAYAKHLAIEQQLWQQEQNLLTSQGYSPTQLYKIKNKQKQAELDQQAADEQEGKKLPQVYRMSEKQQSQYMHSVEQMNQQMQQNDLASYGPRGAEMLQSVYDWYTPAVQQIISDPETSQEEKDRALAQASQRANQELARLKKTPQMRQMRVDTTIDHIMQDPGMQQASAEQRAAFEQMARPVLQDMFDKASAIEESNLSEPEKRRQLQALQEETRRKLSGGQ